MIKLEFTVYGKPQPAGSKTPIPYRKKDSDKLGVRTMDANPKSKIWQTMVREAAREEYPKQLLFREACRLTLEFFRPRPKGHFGSGRNAGILKKSAPVFPITRPDVLKLARGVEDALTGVIWKDDSQIVSEILVKSWGEPARCEVVVELIEEWRDLFTNPLYLKGSPDGQEVHR